jgi:hypothetical protein
MKCPKCGEETVGDGYEYEFCPECNETYTGSEVKRDFIERHKDKLDFCPECGGKLQEDLLFKVCIRCGLKI